jgi:hypothetical protein
VGLGGSFLLATAGLLSAGAIGSHDDDAGAGFELFADYEYLGRFFNAGLRSRYSDENFRQLGLERAPLHAGSIRRRSASGWGASAGWGCCS